MKLRVPGNYTGYYGTIQFQDGVSVGLVSPKQANHMRAIMAGVEILEDDGETVDAALTALSTIQPLGYYVEYGIEPPSKFLTDWNGMYPQATEVVVETAPAEPPPKIVGPYTGKRWTRKELEAVVDAKGIKGLREIAPEGVTGRSANDLIDAILAVAGAAE